MQETREGGTGNKHKSFIKEKKGTARAGKLRESKVQEYKSRGNSKNNKRKCGQVERWEEKQWTNREGKENRTIYRHMH